MATKTVVCPECGSSAAPGRYACAECGALLAAVGAAPRAWAGAPAAAQGPEPAGAVVARDRQDEADAVDGTRGSAQATPSIDASEPFDDGNGADEATDGWTPPPGARTDPAPDLATAMAPATTAAPPVTAAPAMTIAPIPAAAPAPVWPPANDPGMRPLPVERVPAGAWLPPSARLEGLEPPVAAADAKRTSRFDLAALTDSLGVSGDAPRRVVAIGASVAAIAFLLPWANVLAGAGLLGGYFTQWGLAGPGHWIVVALLAGLAAAAIGGERTARWPIGLLGLVAAALLLGLIWPYLFGFLGRSIGVWAVLAGVIVLAVGGSLDRARRHAGDDRSVK
jgi:hypothetical protein